MRVDAETRAFFETLMTETPPAAQKHLRLLLQNQISTMRNKTGRVVWQAHRSLRVVY